MWAATVVKADTARKGGSGFGDIARSPQIDLFIFDGSPKTLDEEMVTSRALSVHAVLDLPGGQHLENSNKVNWLP
jgi:hypothetical protein